MYQVPGTGMQGEVPADLSGQHVPQVYRYLTHVRGWLALRTINNTARDSNDPSHLPAQHSIDDSYSEKVAAFRAPENRRIHTGQLNHLLAALQMSGTKQNDNQPQTTPGQLF